MKIFTQESFIHNILLGVPKLWIVNLVPETINGCEYDIQSFKAKSSCKYIIGYYFGFSLLSIKTYPFISYIMAMTFIKSEKRKTCDEKTTSVRSFKTIPPKQKLIGYVNYYIQAARSVFTHLTTVTSPSHCFVQEAILIRLLVLK